MFEVIFEVTNRVTGSYGQVSYLAETISEALDKFWNDFDPSIYMIESWDLGGEYHD